MRTHERHGCSSKSSEFYGEYQRWKAMKRRCYNINDPHYKDYGARGIKVSSEWKDSFANFISDMGACPQKFSLERRDNAKDYSPENCYWADAYTQANNKRNVKMHTHSNGTVAPLHKFVRQLGIKRSTFYMRVKYYGWTISEALAGKRVT